MIKSFAHKGLKRLAETGSAAGVNPQYARAISRKLRSLMIANTVEELNLPGFGLHPLKGDREGEWAITVSANWRITFSWEEEVKDEQGNVVEAAGPVRVNLEDYH
jgi:proteic killer suppression protein